MADKFRKTMPINITYTAAEQPTAQKLTASSAQARAGTGLIEKAIGDIWGQSGDSHLFSEDLFLQIPNLGRMLGESQFMAPLMHTMCPPIGSEFKFVDRIGIREQGRTTGYLRYIPSGSITEMVGDSFTTLVGAEDLVLADGDYWIESGTGRYRVWKPLASNQLISYMVEVDSWFEAYDRTSANVIPHALQDGFNSCRIEHDAGRFFLHLPPRRPLYTWSMPSAMDKPAFYPAESEVYVGPTSYNEDATIPLGGEYLLWQKKGQDALADAAYRYYLPSIFPANTDPIPDGMLYLWDATNKTIVEGITFKRDDRPGANLWVLEMLTTTQTTFLLARATASEDEADYNSCEVSLIVTGSSAAQRMYQTSAELHTHSHARTAMESVPVSHTDLVETDPPTANDYANGGHPSNTGYPPTIPPWRESKWLWDPHTSLLSRAGAQDSAADERDWINNAMVGHLLLANQDPGNYLDATTPDGSFAIKFGNVSGASAIYQGSAADFRIENNGELTLTLENTGAGTAMGLYSNGVFQAVLSVDPFSDDVCTLRTQLDKLEFGAGGGAPELRLTTTALTPYPGQSITLGSVSYPFTHTYSTRLGLGGDNSVFLIQNNLDKWEVNSTGALLPVNHEDIGTSLRRCSYIYGQHGNFSNPNPGEYALDVTGRAGEAGGIADPQEGIHVVGGDGVESNQFGADAILAIGGDGYGSGRGGAGIRAEGHSSNGVGYGGHGVYAQGGDSAVPGLGGTGLYVIGGSSPTVQGKAIDATGDVLINEGKLSISKNYDDNNAMVYIYRSGTSGGDQGTALTIEGHNTTAAPTLLVENHEGTGPTVRIDSITGHTPLIIQNSSNVGPHARLIPVTHRFTQAELNAMTLGTIFFANDGTNVGLFVITVVLPSSDAWGVGITGIVSNYSVAP